MIPCSAGCKRQVADEDAATAASWDYLSITARWRCPTCWRELRAAQSFTGVEGQTADNLAPGDRGAIRKETASTILPASVKP